MMKPSLVKMPVSRVSDKVRLKQVCSATDKLDCYITGENPVS